MIDLKTCPKCGKKFPDEYMFCMECGSELGVTRPKGKTLVPSRRKEEAKAGKAKPTPAAARPKRRRVTRSTMRMVWEGFLVFGGLGLLISSFLLAYGQIGVIPRMGNMVGVVTSLALGVALTIIGLRGASDEVRMGGGNAFGAAGLVLLIFSFMRAYELMGQTPGLTNVLWLSIIMAVGIFLTVMGVPTMHELRVNGRKTWGSAFTATSLIALALAIFTIHAQVEKATQLSNAVWPSIMIFLGAFLAWEGFPLVREPKDSIRMIWDGVFMAACIGTAALTVLTAVNLANRTSEWANALTWLVMLIAICVVFGAKGIGLVRE